MYNSRIYISYRVAHIYFIATLNIGMKNTKLYHLLKTVNIEVLNRHICIIFNTTTDNVLSQLTLGAPFFLDPGSA